MAGPIVEKGCQKHAWMLLAGVAMFGLVLGLGDFIAGAEALLPSMSWQELQSQNPGIAAFIEGMWRERSIFLMAFSGLSMVLFAEPFRRGGRWAWWSAWIWVAVLFGLLGIGATSANWPIVTIGFILLALALLGLLLPYKRFFPTIGIPSTQSG